MWRVSFLPETELGLLAAHREKRVLSLEKYDHVHASLQSSSIETKNGYLPLPVITGSHILDY